MHQNRGELAVLLSACRNHVKQVKKEGLSDIFPFPTPKTYVFQRFHGYDKLTLNFDWIFWIQMMLQDFIKNV
jgi:hypothetical protein